MRFVNKEKLKKDIEEAIKKYEDLPLDVNAVNDSFIEEIANVVVSQAFDIDALIESIRIFNNMEI